MDSKQGSRHQELLKALNFTMALAFSSEIIQLKKQIESDEDEREN